LLEVSELNPGLYPWLSDDGLTTLERENSIWTGTSGEQGFPFADKKECSEDGTRTVTGDGLEMVLLVAQPTHRKKEVLLCDEAGPDGSHFKRATP